MQGAVFFLDDGLGVLRVHEAGLLRICLCEYMVEKIYVSRRICDNGWDESPIEP